MKQIPKLLSRWLLVSLLLTGLNVSAATDMFLKIHGVSGESQDASHGGEIDVLAWAWGMSNAGSFHLGGGGGAGTASFQDLSITKYVDKSTPELMARVSTGQPISVVTLTVRKAGTNPLEYYSITMSDVLVTHLSTGGSGGVERLTEHISLNFARVDATYIQVLPSGDLGDQVGYARNIQANTGGGATTTPTDSDNDGLPDSTDPDDDDDGMPDSYEQAYGFKRWVEDGNLDADGDTLTNLEEFQVGTDPTLKDSVFKSTISYVPGSSAASLSWPSVAGMDYRVLSAASMTNTFLSMGVYPSDGNDTTSILVPQDTTRRMFRVEAIIK